MMRDWKSTLAVMLVFALGCAAGVLVAFIVMRQHVTSVLQRDSPAYEQILERRLTRGLDLDESQRERFHEALTANIEARKSLQKQIQPQVQALNIQTRRELRSILKPEQFAIFRRNLEDFRRRFGSPGLGGRGIDQAVGDTNAAMPVAGTNEVPQAN
jgi:hypothetical protein